MIHVAVCASAALRCWRGRSCAVDAAVRCRQAAASDQPKTMTQSDTATDRCVRWLSQEEPEKMSGSDCSLKRQQLLCAQLSTRPARPSSASTPVRCSPLTRHSAAGRSGLRRCAHTGAAHCMSDITAHHHPRLRPHRLQLAAQIIPAPPWLTSRMRQWPPWRLRALLRLALQHSCVASQEGSAAYTAHTAPRALTAL